MATTVADVSLIDGVIADDPAPVTAKSLRGVRLGLPKAVFQDNLSSAVATRLEEIISTLQSEGVVFVEHDIPDLAALVEETSLITLGGAFRADMVTYLEERNTSVAFETLAAQIANPFIRGWLEPYLAPTDDILQSYRETMVGAMPRLKRTLRPI